MVCLPDFARFRVLFVSIMSAAADSEPRVEDPGGQDALQTFVTSLHHKRELAWWPYDVHDCRRT